MATRAPRFTLAEREAVVTEAIELIKEPASWITGQWKCELYQTDEKGEYLKDGDGQLMPVRDLYNRPQAQYCIEGAVNQAVYNVLGEERARKLGAYSEEAGFEGQGEEATMWPTDILGIDALVRERHADIVGEEERAAMTLNDSFSSDRATGHKLILGLLRDTLESIKARRKR